MTHFGTTRKGRTVDAISICAADLTVTILTYGAIVQDVRLKGVDRNLSLGSADLGDYEDTMGYFGAIVGPIANRISNARVRLDGMMYELERNENGQTHLHSGRDGVHCQVWDIAAQSADSVTLQLNMPDGMAGLPGRRNLRVTYQVTAPATLTMTIDCETDTATCMNFASHIYWNLDGASTFEGHTLQIAAEHYLPIDDRVCPTGEICPVDGTDMDFRSPRQMQIGAPALDHNFCLSTKVMPLRDVLWLTGQSGLKMTIATTEPGVQIHDAAGSGRPGKGTYEGVVIEPQRWPDAPNNPRFPSITVRPDKPYHQITSWTFESTP